jgi:hypothetical protein
MSVLQLLYRGQVTLHHCGSPAALDSHLEGAWDRAALLHDGQWYELIATRWQRCDDRPF